jgi:hypothetical protein
MTTQLRKGWMLAGSNPGDYEVGTDTTKAHGGRASGYIKAKASPPDGYGTLMQLFKANEYRGQRLRMTAYVKAENIQNGAGLWMRLDGPNGQMLGFDNMQARPIKGTSDWAGYQVVLDVPEESAVIAFGILLVGEGQAWADDFAFDVVGDDVPTTGGKSNNSYPDRPQNLDFESSA